MAWKLTVSTLDKTQYVSRAHEVVVTPMLNEKGMLRFVALPGYVPARFAEVVAYSQDGVTPVYGGVVRKRTTEGVETGAVSHYTIIDCEDWWFYAEACFVSLTYTVDTALEDVLGDLAAALAATYGTFFYTPVATGVTLSAFKWTDMKVADALRQITDRTGYVFRFSPVKELVAGLPGVIPGAFTISDGATHCRSFEWEDSDVLPANKVTLRCGPDGVGATLADAWVGTGVLHVFAFHYPVDALAGTLDYDGLNHPVGTYGLDVMEWTYRASDNTLVQDPTYGAPGLGVPMSMNINPMYPFVVTVASGATPIIEYRQAEATLLQYPPALQTALGILAQMNQQPRVANVVSLEVGWGVGQGVAVNLTSRAAVATFSIDDLTITLDPEGAWIYNFRATEGTTFQGSYLSQYRKIGVGGGGSSSGGGIGAVTISGGPPSPIFLGGSLSVAVAPDPAAYLPVPSRVTYVAGSSYTGRMRAELCSRDAGVGVTARLHNVTDDTVPITTAKVTATTPTMVEAVGAIVIGKTYRLEVVADTNGGSALGIGQLEQA